MARTTVRLLVIIAATLVTSTAFAAQGSYDRQLSAPPGGRLTFRTDVGSVTLVGHRAPEVVIHAQLQGPKSLLGQLHISAKQTPSGVRIIAHLDHDGWSEGFHWLYFESIRVHFTIEAPRGYPIDLGTSGGSIDVRDMSAGVRAATSGGGVRLQDVAGAVSVQTSGGDIHARHLSGSAELSTSGGDIDIADSRDDLRLRTSGGGIRMHNDDGSVHARTSGGDMRAQLRANHGIHISSSGGDVTLLLPRSTHASIDAQSSGGQVTCDFPLSSLQISSGSHLSGDIGGGGAAIHVRGAGGDIRIAPQQ